MFCAGSTAVDSALKTANDKLMKEVASLQQEVMQLKATAAMRDQLQEAVVKAAVATAEAEIQKTAHGQFREGMTYAQQLTATARQMV